MPDETTTAGSPPAGSSRGVPAVGGVPRPWQASYPPGVPSAYDYPDVPLTRLLDDAAEDFPDAVAVDYLGRRTTYRQLLDAVDRLAGAFALLGVRRGDRIAVLLPDCPQHLVTLFAAWRTGAVVTEHDPAADELRLERELNDAGCRVVVCLEETYRTLARLKGRLHSVVHVVATRPREALPWRRRAPAAWRARSEGAGRRIPVREGVLGLAALVEANAPGLAQVRLDPRTDLAAVLYTGSTAPGPGVMLTHANLLAGAFQTRLWLPDVQAGREVVLAGAPLSDGFGLAACALPAVLSAATLVLLPRPDPALVRRAVRRRKPSLLVGEAWVYRALAEGSDGKRQDLSSVRVCLSVGCGLSEPVARTVERRTGGKLREGWSPGPGGALTHANPVYGRAKAGTAGLPVPDTTCLVVDPRAPDRPVGPGVTGELLVAGPQVTRGFWNAPLADRATFVEGWLRTGMLARMDPEGYFTILGPVRAADRAARHG